MKTCLTCGASVADDAEVCPDCGMEFESASAPAAAPAAPATPAASSDAADFAADFGGDNAAVAPINLDAPAFEFSGSESTVVLEKSAAAAAPDAATPPPMEPAATAMAQITLRRGGALTGETFRFGGGAVVGRFDPDSGPVDVDLAPLPEASYVSRHHAEFRHDAGSGQWFVKDMGSSNGTFWRAGAAGAFARLSGEQELNAGDEISLGNARFEFGVD